MNNRALTLSLVMAVLAIFFVQSYVSSIEEATKKKFGTQVLVVQAKRDIKEMETIDETMLELTLVPKRFLEPSAISFEKKKQDADVIKSMKDLAGNVAVVPIKKGEQITYNKIIEPGMRTGLSPQITPGKRAISVPVTEITGVSKLVKPGDRVDLIAVLDMGGGKQNKISKTVLQDVGVLAVGHNVTDNIPRLVEMDSFSGKPKVTSLTQTTNFSTVTLEVDPMQAQMIALVLSNSDNALTLALRNNDDADRTNFAGVTLPDVLGPDAARAQQRLPAGRR